MLLTLVCRLFKHSKSNISKTILPKGTYPIKKHARTAGNVQSITSLQGDGGTIEAIQVVSGTVFASRHLDTCALVAFFFIFFYFYASFRSWKDKNNENTFLE